MIPAHPPRRRLWQPGDFVVLYAVNLVGVTLLVASAWASSAADDLSLRIAWVNLGVIALLVAGLGNAFWLLAGRRAIGERRVRLLPSPDPDARTTGAESVAPRADGGELVAIEGSGLFHRGDCPLVASKTVGLGDRVGHERAGRNPCGVCQP